MSGINAFFWVLAIGLCAVAFAIVLTLFVERYDEWRSSRIMADARHQMDWLAKRSTFVGGEWVTRFTPAKRYFGDHEYARDVYIASSEEAK